MTVTETDAPSEVTSHVILEPPKPAKGLAALLGSGDHKTIGRLWIGASFVFLVLAGVAGELVALEKVDAAAIDLFDWDLGRFGQVYSFHAVVGVYLFLLPLLLGLATVVVPLQVGASTVAFPRAAAAAFWGYLVSGGLVVASYLADGGPFGADSDGVGLFIASMLALLVSLCLAAVCIATTVLGLRAEGMGLHRVPLFAWSNLLAATIWLLTLPVLAAVLLLAYIDLRYGQTFLGGADGVFSRMTFSWSQPAVYAFAIPVLGVIGDVVPVAASTRITLHRVAMGCIGVYAALSFGAWAMPSFAPGTDGDLILAYADEVPFIGFSFLIIAPLLVFTGLLADTLRRGSLALPSPLLWGFSALLMLLAGAGNGALVSVEPLDLVGTSAMAAQQHYVLAAALLAGFGGLVWWASKIWGQDIAEGPSKGLAVAGLLGTILLCLPDLITGFLSQPARLGTPTDDVETIEALNGLSLAGGALLVLVGLATAALVLKAAATGGGDHTAGSDEDPWEGHTLEWATSSPPAPGNFSELPAILSEAPLYDARYATEADK